MKFLNECMTTKWKANYWINIKITEWNETKLNKNLNYLVENKLLNTKFLNKNWTTGKKTETDEIVKGIEHKNELLTENRNKWI